MVEADFRLLVVWTNTIKSDDAAGAGSAAALFDDPRVHQFHDPERRVGRLFAPVIKMPSMREVAAARGVEPAELERSFGKSYVYGEAAVFDTVFFFPPGVEWGDAPPEPAGWVTQLDPAMFMIDAERFRFGEAMGDEMARLADVLFERQRAERDAQAPAGERVFESELELSLGDLARFQDRFVAAVREAAPGAKDGRVRLLASVDGRSFEPLAVVSEAGSDLRDPRLSAAPDGRLLLLCEASDPARPATYRTRIATSPDGAAWTPLRPPEGVPEGSLLAGLAWHEELASTLATRDGGRTAVHFRSADGLSFERSSPDLAVPTSARVGGLALKTSGAMVALLAGADPGSSLLLQIDRDTSQRRGVACGLAGAAPLPRPDGRFLAGARDGERGAARVMRISLDGACEQALELAGSAGAGRVALLKHAGELWIAYAVDDEGGSGLCVARVDLAGL